MDGEQQQKDQSNQHPLSFLQGMEWTGGGLLLGILFFLIFFVILNYFNIIRLSELYPNYLGFLPHKPYQQENKVPAQTNPPRTPVPAVGKFTLSCPVPKELCNSGKYLTYNGNPALVYNLPPKTQVFSATPVVDLTNLTSAAAGVVRHKILRQTSIFSSDCYTITYTLPPDVSLEKIDLLPLERGRLLATVSASLLTAGEEKANLIIQIQKRVIEQTLLGKPEFEQCSATNVNPKQIGDYQPIETIEIQ